jgi:hypothetical protein
MTVRSNLGRYGIVTTAAMRAIMGHDQGSPSVLAVFVALTTHADRDEEVGWRCSVKSIAEEAGVSERSVRTAKAVLIDLGLLDVTANWTQDGDRGWDSYMIHYLPRVAPDEQGVGQPLPEVSADSAAFSSDQETDPSTDSSSVPAKRLPMPAVTQPDMFDEFWSTYGNLAGTGRRKAIECWNNAMKRGDDPEQIIDGLRAWVLYWKSPNAAKAMFAQGFLNQQKWATPPPPIRTEWQAGPGGNAIRRGMQRAHSTNPHVRGAIDMMNNQPESPLPGRKELNS